MATKKEIHRSLDKAFCNILFGIPLHVNDNPIRKVYKEEAVALIWILENAIDGYDNMPLVNKEYNGIVAMRNTLISLVRDLIRKIKSAMAINKMFKKYMIAFTDVEANALDRIIGSLLDSKGFRILKENKLLCTVITAKPHLNGKYKKIAEILAKRWGMQY